MERAEAVDQMVARVGVVWWEVAVAVLAALAVAARAVASVVVVAGAAVAGGAPGWVVEVMGGGRTGPR